MLLTRYRLALGLPGMARTMLAAFIAYLLSGMMSLSLLLAIENITGSYAVAGLVAGGYAGALAFAAPLWGRLVDRRGPGLPLVLAPSLLWTATAALITLALTVKTPALLVVVACLAGACAPPSASVVRRAMATVEEEGTQRTLFAITGFIMALVFVTGPLLVAVVVAFLDPLWAVGLAAVASGVGAFLLRGAALVRELDREAALPESSSARRSGSWNAEQVRILVVIALGSFAIGGVQVAIVAHAQDLRTNAGVFIAVLAVGAMIASFLYGGLSLPGRLPLQLAVSLGAYGVLILMLTTSPGLVASALLLLFIGAATGPADGIEAMLVGKYSPAAVQAQAFAVLVTANWIGFAVGNAVCGALVDDVSRAAGVIAAGASALAAAALVLVPLPRAAPVPVTSD